MKGLEKFTGHKSNDVEIVTTFRMKNFKFS